jgi:ketosteroid isomerase-like protein
MGYSNALSSGNIIDSASMLLGSKPQPPSRDAQQRQRAMQLRLAQLNAAMGQPDDIMQDPEFAPPPEATAKPASSKIALIIVALAAAIGWTALFSQTGQTQKPTQPAAAPVLNAPVATAAPAVPVTVAQPTISDEAAVNELLKAWRSAWSQRDVAAYLGVYSQDFQPADGSSRSAWAAARTKKVAAGAPITLDIHQLTLDRIDADHFKASFRQDYAAGNYRETARQKTMLIAREGSAWRIVEERQE